MQFRYSPISFAIIPFFLFFSTATVAWSQSFSVSATPETLTIHPGDQNIPLTVSVSDSSYTGPISVTLSGLPSGITVTPLTLTAGGSGTLDLDASIFADSEGFPADEASGPVSVPNTVTVIAVAGAMRASTTITLTVSLSNPSFTPSTVDLPVVRIDTNGVPVTDTTTDVPGTITITSADGQTSYLTDASATFHVHGNSTALMPKKPYNIKLDDSLDLLNVMGLTCPYVTSSGKVTCDKSKTYILLANYDDKTLLRDWSASALANGIPMGNGYLSSPAGSPSPSGTSELMPWAPHSLFVELYLNGVYEGNYQLIEKVNVDSHRINITELGENDTTGDLSGGYFMEIDEHEDEAYVFITPHGVPIGLQDPDFSPDPEVPEQTSWITAYVDAAENALFSANFTDPSTGWRAYFDEASAANFYIVNDVMGNRDGGAFVSSDYLYKEKDNPLLYMGPIWDFDVSSGNLNYDPISNPTVPWMQTQAVWYKQLFTDPGFKADVARQFDALKNNGVFTNWLNSISAQAAKLEQSEANNFQRWPILGIKVWPNLEAAGSYSGELNYLLTYLKLRIAYLDSELNGKAGNLTTLDVSDPTVRAGSPVTLTAHITAESTPTGTVTFLLQNTLSPYSMVGPTATLDSGANASATVSDLPAGNYNLSAVYSGDDHNGLSSSATTGISVLPPLIATTTSIATSNTSVETGKSVTFTASVTSASGTTSPTGTLTFTSNGNTLGTAPLAAGSATFTTTNLPGGNDSVEAAYSGDGTYQTSSSPEIAMTVTGIALKASPTSATVQGGAAATFSLTVTPENGFSEAVTFACSGLPAGASCSFSPATVAIARGAATSTLTISTAPLAAAGFGVNGRINTGAMLGGGIAAALAILLVYRRRTWPAVAFAMVIAGSVAAVGCGSAGDASQQQTYSVTVIASGRSASQSTVLDLTVTN